MVTVGLTVFPGRRLQSIEPKNGKQAGWILQQADLRNYKKCAETRHLLFKQIAQLIEPGGATIVLGAETTRCPDTMNAADVIIEGNTVINKQTVPTFAATVGKIDSGSQDTARSGVKLRIVNEIQAQQDATFNIVRFGIGTHLGSGIGARIDKVAAADVAGGISRQQRRIINAAQRRIFRIQARTKENAAITSQFVRIEQSKIRKGGCGSRGDFGGHANIREAYPTGVVTAINHIDRIAAGLGKRKVTVVIRGIHIISQAQLTQIVDTVGPIRLFLCRRQRGQQHGGQNGDDGDDHQQFNESKAPVCRSMEFNSFHLGFKFVFPLAFNGSPETTAGELVASFLTPIGLTRQQRC